jgi:uncharacterized protein YggE
VNKIILVLIGFFFFLQFSLHNQAQDKIPALEVFGTANIKVNPDILIFSINVQTENNNVIYAKNENDKTVINVIDVLKYFGIQENDIQTSGLRINKNYNYNENVKEFSISNSISFKLNDLSKYYELTAELIKIEHVFISYSTYDYSKMIETRRQARENALIAAKNKAEEMAAVLGQGIVKPLFVSEEQVSDYYPNPFNASTQNENLGNSYGVLKEGTINVTAKVKIVFELLTK